MVTEMLVQAQPQIVMPRTIYQADCWEHFHPLRLGEYRCSTPGGDCPLVKARAAVRWHLKWSEVYHNIVVTAGLNHVMSRLMRSSAVGGATLGYNDGRRLPTAWIASTAYSVGDVVRPTGASAQDPNNRFFVCQVAGTSAGSQPTWPNTAGGTVTDNTVTWAEGSQWYIGLVNGPTETDYNPADTMASHAGWTENVTYSNTTRVAYIPGAVSAGSCNNSGNLAAFNINGSATISGSFLTDIQTKGGTAGLLYGVGAYTGGDRSLTGGDTLNVTVTTSATSA
jgi:hypothetical protein